MTASSEASSKEAVPSVEELIAMRNAVEHPEGLSGKLVIANFTLGTDRKLDEPTWHREKDGKLVTEPSSIRDDMDACIHNLLTLGEDVFVSWASNEVLLMPGRIFKANAAAVARRRLYNASPKAPWGRVRPSW